MRLLILLFLLVHAPFVFAEEPFLKQNDVIAIVGGEDMVVASELGFLEAQVQAQLPGYGLKFRSQAWEGDTVYEQRRDLNYPTLEAQLAKIGATVVIAQFGQMESLGGMAKLPEFIAAYEKLIGRLRGTQGRRVVLVPPSAWRGSNDGLSLPPRTEDLAAYRRSIAELASKLSTQGVLAIGEREIILRGNSGSRDGAHMDENAHQQFALSLAVQLTGAKDGLVLPETVQLHAAVVAKNRMWHDYSRPQNWAFLAGDRTNQPSSRDHKDMLKRWFPEELEKFVPLIEAKEKEIWELAGKAKR